MARLRVAFDRGSLRFDAEVHAALPKIAPSARFAERLRDLIGPPVFEIEVSELAGTHLAALETIRISVSLAADERAMYEDDLAAFSAGGDRRPARDRPRDAPGEAARRRR